MTTIDTRGMDGLTKADLLRMHSAVVDKLTDRTGEAHEDGARRGEGVMGERILLRCPHDYAAGACAECELKKGESRHDPEEAADRLREIKRGERRDRIDGA